MNKSLIILICAITSTVMQAQNNIEAILSSVESNNAAIATASEFQKVQSAEFRTGTGLDNPQINFGYFPGTKSEYGTKTAVGISQSFDFPTTYSRKKQLYSQYSQQAVLELNKVRQSILLQTLKTCYEMIWLNKMNAELQKRVDNTEKLLKAFETRLAKGDVSILEVDKARLQLLNLECDLRKNETARKQLELKLIQLNGGQQIKLDDVNYPIAVLTKIDSVLTGIKNKAPDLQLSTNDIAIAESQVKLQKASRLPSFSIGYELETEPAVGFHGVRVGMSLPLWGNIRQVKKAKAQTLYETKKNEGYVKFIESEIKQNYENVITLKSNLEAYEEALKSVNSLELLEKSMNLGEISSIEYFREISYYYNIYNDFMEIERDYYLAVAELNRYSL